MNRALGGFVFATLCFTASPALSQILVDASAPELIEQIAYNHGETELTRDGIGWPRITVTPPSGRSYTLDFFRCEQGGVNCKVVWVRARFEDAIADLETINAFNRDHLIARAYVDGLDVPVLQLDLILFSKVSTDWLDTMLAGFTTLVDQFGETIEG
jgi:hypothetical protein